MKNYYQRMVTRQTLEEFIQQVNEMHPEGYMKLIANPQHWRSMGIDTALQLAKHLDWVTKEEDLHDAYTV